MLANGYGEDREPSKSCDYKVGRIVGNAHQGNFVPAYRAFCVYVCVCLSSCLMHTFDMAEEAMIHW